GLWRQRLYRPGALVADLGADQRERFLHLAECSPATHGNTLCHLCRQRGDPWRTSLNRLCGQDWGYYDWQAKSAVQWFKCRREPACNYEWQRRHWHDQSFSPA